MSDIEIRLEALRLASAHGDTADVTVARAAAYERYLQGLPSLHGRSATWVGPAIKDSTDVS